MTFSLSKFREKRRAFRDKLIASLSWKLVIAMCALSAGLLVIAFATASERGEQFILWTFGLSLIALAAMFLHKNHIGYAAVLAFLGIISFCFGISGVQNVVRTVMTVSVDARLAGYGKQIDDFQNTVASLQQGLTNQHAQIQQTQSRLNSTAKQLANDEKGIEQQEHSTAARLEETETLRLQLQTQVEQLRQDTVDLTNRFEQLTAFKASLSEAQSNLDVQERKLAGVENLVDSIFSNSIIEVFDGLDSVHVAARPIGLVPWEIGMKYQGILTQGPLLESNPTVTHQVFFVLQAAPLKNTIEAEVRTLEPGMITGIPIAGPLLGQLVGPPIGRSPGAFTLHGFQVTNNIAYIDIPNYSLHTIRTFSIRYIKDIRQTNLIQKVTIRGTNAFLDGIQFDYVNPVKPK